MGNRYTSRRQKGRKNKNLGPCSDDWFWCLNLLSHLLERFGMRTIRVVETRLHGYQTAEEMRSGLQQCTLGTYSSPCSQQLLTPGALDHVV